MTDDEKQGLGSRVRSAYRFWSTDERFAWGAWNQFIVMAPVSAVIAIICLVVQAWLPAIVFGIGAVYMGNYLVEYRRRRSD